MRDEIWIPPHSTKNYLLRPDKQNITQIWLQNFNLIVQLHYVFIYIIFMFRSRDNHERVFLLLWLINIGDLFTLMSEFTADRKTHQLIGMFKIFILMLFHLSNWWIQIIHYCVVCFALERIQFCTCISDQFDFVLDYFIGFENNLERVLAYSA